MVVTSLVPHHFIVYIQFIYIGTYIRANIEFDVGIGLDVLDPKHFLDLTYANIGN